MGSPKNIFRHLKVGVWVLFCKALILLGPIILVDHDFDLYGTLSWPQTVDIQTLVALVWPLQRCVPPSSGVVGGTVGCSSWPHGAWFSQAAASTLPVTPAAVTEGTSASCQGMGYHGPGHTCLSVLCVAITPHLDWGFSLHMAFLQERNKGSCPKFCFQANTGAGLPAEKVGVVLPLPPSQTQLGTVYRPKILCLPVGIREEEKVIQGLGPWLCSQNRPCQRHKAERCDHLYQLYMTIYH